MATEAISPPTTPAPKLSRYRSVRKAQEQQAAHHHSAPPVPPVPPMPALPEMQPAQKDAPVSRSMSRYHRRAPTAHATIPNPIPPPLPATQPRSNTLNSHVAPPAPSQPTTSRSRAVSSPHTSHTSHQRPRTAKQRADPSPPVTARQQSLKNDDSARQLLQKEKERQRLLKEKYEAEARLQREAKQAEIDRLEQIRKEEEEAALRKAQEEAEAAEALRRQKEQEKAEQDRGKRLRKAEAQRMLDQREEDARRAKQEESDRKARQEQERVRARAQSQSQARKAPSMSPPVSPPRHDANLSLFRRKKDHSMSPEAPVITTRRAPSEEAIRPGGGGIVPGIDAPTSAVNAGDRRVTVVCGSKRIQLPVTPTTTPLDLIKTAATVLTEPIDVRTAVIQEHFIKVSITRPLRNYEYVRDVMNSWDFDNQNDLTIIHADDGGIDQDDLLAYKVSETRPEGMSCLIQYSSRPGKWSKRWITLKPDGQLVMSKNEKAKEKDQESVLTMTDYDIYDVTQQKLQKVKPPKKICYAVKSLQKSNIFADESQYVHFFCTNDRATSLLFYKALQGWRSWYLKHELGEGLKKKAPASRKVSDADAAKPSAGLSHGHTRGESVGSHYQLGAFSSLLDLDDFNKKLDQIEVHRPGEFPEDKPLAGLGSRALHARNKSLRVKHAPPVSFNRSAPAIDSASQNMTRQPSVRRSMDRSEEGTFSSGGLLGRGYTQRQAQAQDREQKQTGPSPFTDGPSLISGLDVRLAAIANDSGLNRRSSTRSNHKRHSSDLTRSMSKRAPGMPEPLIDLTPQYKPPPQHANKGKGYNPTSGSGPLVESATSVEEAIKVPSSTDWRARPGTARVQGMHGRTKSLKGRGEPLAAYTTNNHSGAPEDDRDAFTGGGLLSQPGYQGYAQVGRGVMDGSKARGPMIDLANSNNFAFGSLLSALPDSNAQVIDRSGK